VSYDHNPYYNPAALGLEHAYLTGDNASQVVKDAKAHVKGLDS
jgi:hypothetical protein